ncbi:hypothetical protein SKAU_G00007550 [Synaphobranchus kaupii]|uniref:Uncharacterized protein n=1 Tax=Synaphobranchus kaupii TaxID=118154 RepID=A0A9Q1JD05_SYNKA|nr:hypothetical protein SKAU_G00007550 [Synaphobranchus kaupii]
MSGSMPRSQARADHTYEHSAPPTTLPPAGFTSVPGLAPHDMKRSETAAEGLLFREGDFRNAVKAEDMAQAE